MDHIIRRTWAEINLDALIHNLNVVKSKTNGKIIAVVKADAYGHGATVVASFLEQNGVDSFAVSNIDEALELRRDGINKPILILGYTPANCAEMLAENSIVQAVFSTEYADALNAAAREANVILNCHLKLDTGMGRIGFDCRSADQNGISEASRCLSLSNLLFNGVFTHFAAADLSGDETGEFTKNQYSLFVNAVSALQKNGLNAEYIHCSNSAATMLSPEFSLTANRAGIILYGLTPSDELDFGKELIPVMSFKSTVSMVKTIKRGESVSYGRTFTADKAMTVATVPVGYADGFRRNLSNKGYVLINGEKADIIGRVCMDQMVVDVTNIDSVKMGDEVLLFGKDLPVEVPASLCETINYEMVCAVSRRVPRVYIKGGKILQTVSYI